jgi:hypothetical protein
MKRCTKCGETKPAAEFHCNPRMRSGLSSWCRDCHLARVREWRAANPEYERRRNEKRRAAYPAKRRHNYPDSGRKAATREG